MMKLSEHSVITKTRYLVDFKRHTWEVDEFHGDNEGLVVAEIELDDENEIFEKPDWLDDEVTADYRYLNSNLSKLSYKAW
jgi:CYTH domain-containing protein